VAVALAGCTSAQTHEPPKYDGGFDTQVEPNVDGTKDAGAGGQGGKPAALGPAVRTQALKVTRGEDEWPQFARSAANISLAEARVPVAPVLAWQIKLPGQVAYATPVLGDHKIFVSMYGFGVGAFSSKTGAMVWNNRTLKAGKYGTPAYAGGRVFVAAGFSSDKVSTIAALDGETGEEAWRATEASSGALKVQGDALYASEYDGVFALDLATGKTRWKSNLGCASDPAIVNGVLYCAGKGSLFAYKALTGELLWQKPTGVALHVSAPAIAGEAVYFVGEDGLYAHALSSGNLLWKAEFSPSNFSLNGGTWIETSPAVAYGRVYVVGAQQVQAFSAQTGKPVWSANNGRGGSSVAVADGVVIANGSFMLDADTGEELWKAPEDLQMVGSPVVVDGFFYVNTFDRLVAWTGLIPGVPID